MKYLCMLLFFAAIWFMSAWDSGIAGVWALWTSYAIMAVLGAPIIIAEYCIKKESASCDQQENGQI